MSVPEENLGEGEFNGITISQIKTYRIRPNYNLELINLVDLSQAIPLNGEFLAQKLLYRLKKHEYLKLRESGHDVNFFDQLETQKVIYECLYVASFKSHLNPGRRVNETRDL